MTDSFRILAQELTNILRPHGFRASGLRWRNLTVPAVVRDLTVEKFRFNTPGHLRFRLMLDLYLATGEVGEFVFPRLPGRYTLAVRTSDGALRGEPEVYQPLPDDPAAPAFRAGLESHLRTQVLPLLDAATDVEAVERLAEELNRRVGQDVHAASLAVALARLGRQAAARAQFRRALGDPAALRAMAARQGIELDD